MDRSLFAAAPGHVLRSTDGGATWRASAVATPAPQITALVISPDFAVDGTLLLGTLEDGIFRSTDRGEHWSSGNFGLLDLSVNCIAISPGFASDETMFAGTQTGLFCSRNGGRAWREVPMPVDPAPILSLALAPNFGQHGILLAGTDSLGVYRSDDQGRTWHDLRQAVVDSPVNQIVLSRDFPEQPDVLVVLSDRLLVSHDGGQQWLDWKTELALEQLLMCAAFPDGLSPDRPFLIGQADGGVLRVA